MILAAEIILYHFQTWLHVKQNTEIISKLFWNNFISHVTAELDGIRNVLCCYVAQGGRHDVRDDAADYESDADATTRYDKVVRLGTTKSRLFIDCARPHDAGVYTCVAETPTLRIVTTIVLRVGEWDAYFSTSCDGILYVVTTWA